MGFWGYKLYENDIALDVKDEFIELLKKGMDCVSATKQMIEGNAGLLQDEEDCPVFWFALADTQWDYGILLDEVKQQAIQQIDSGTDLKVWETASPSDYNKRKTVLLKLREKLLSTQPDKKKIRTSRLFRCDWKLGDVFAYQLRSEKAKELGVYGCYLLLQKVDEGTWHPGHVVPIVYAKITSDNTLPTSVEEYNRLSYVQIFFTRYENRLYPFSSREEYERHLKQKYEVDEYGFLPQYRVLLITTSKRVIPKDLIYVGNYISAKMPEKEFIPHTKLNISYISWKCKEDTIETEILRRYCLYNLRQCEVYQKH